MRGIVWVAGILIFMLGVCAGLWTAVGPNCPTEDSCIAQYYDGGWHITQVTP